MLDGSFIGRLGAVVTCCAAILAVAPAASGQSCAGNCEGSPDDNCFCDELCDVFDDCCDDVCDACPELSFCDAGGGSSCAGNCGSSADTCFCDEDCAFFEDCCDDVCDECPELSFCGGGGGSNCCEDHGGFGCDDPTCEACVCAIDSFCCDVAWDGLCADIAGPSGECCGSCPCGVRPTPPPNDACADRMDIPDGSTAFSNVGATTDGPAINDTGGCTSVEADIWFNYTATCSGLVTVSLCASDYDTAIAVYDGCDCPASTANQVACNDDLCGVQSEVTFTAADNCCYKIRVGGFAGEQGSGTIAITPGMACVPTRECGNGMLECGEECDDGNTASGDGCSDSCQVEVGPPPNELYVEVDCSAGGVVTATVGMRNLDQTVTGFDAKLQFDSTFLTFVSGMYTATPFETHIPMTITAVGNTVELNGAECLFPPVDDPTACDGTMADAVLATLTFTAGSGLECQPSTIEFIDNPPFYVGLAFQGNPVLTTFTDDTFNIDTVPPTLVCAPGEMIDCPATPMFTDPTVSDTCDSDPDVTFTTMTSPPSGSCPGGFTTTRTWEAVDDCGNVSTCSQTISVGAPPNELYVEVDPCPGSPGTLTATVGMRNLNTLVTGFDAKLQFNTMHLTFVSGNYETDTDPGPGVNTEPFETHIPPTITASMGTIELNGAECLFPPVDDPTACDGTMDDAVLATLTFDIAPGLDCVMSTIEFIDNPPFYVGLAFQGNPVMTNFAADTFTIDSAGPDIMCPAPAMIDCSESTDPMINMALGMATATDACSGVDDISFTDSDAPGNCAGNHVITRTWTATDECGNTSMCMQTITVTDTTGPAIMCPMPASIDCTVPPTPANTGMATAMDDCSGVMSITFSDSPPPAGDCANDGITRTWTATDNCGNTSTCTQVITVTDDTGPTIMCPANTSIDCSESTDPSNTGSATAMDDCSGVMSITSSDSDAPGNCAGNHVITRTWTATDNCGNSNSCDQTITVTDTTPPMITCPMDMTVECDGAGNMTALADFLEAASASDDCSGVTIMSDFTSLSDDCGATGSALVTWTATDGCGQSSMCSATFTIEDTTAPMLTCPMDTTVECDGMGNMAALDAFLSAASANDACGSVSVTNDFVSLSDDCGATGSATVTWTATDDCGLTSMCSATFTIEDTTAPDLTCPPDITVECDGMGNAADLAVFLAGAATSDDCGSVMLVNDFVSLSDDCGATGSAMVTWTATDDCGLTSMCSATFTIEDTTAPTISVPPDVVVDADAGGCTAVVDPGMATGSDTCSEPVMITFVREDGQPNLSDPFSATFPGMSGIGVTQITWTATDACGQMSSDVQTVTVNAVNTVTATVVLDDVNLGMAMLTRCIKFIAKTGSNCAPPVYVPIVFSGTPAMGTATFDVACGNWTSLCAKDEQHTIYDTQPMVVDGLEFDVPTPLTLLGGDTDNDSDVDIDDVTFLLFRFGLADPPNPMCNPWSLAIRGSNFDNVGVVGTGDYSILSSNWQAITSCLCAGPAIGGGEPVTRTRVNALTLPADVSARADRNRDGWVDYKDVADLEARFGLGSVLSSKIRAAEQPDH